MQTTTSFNICCGKPQSRGLFKVWCWEHTSRNLHVIRKTVTNYQKKPIYGSQGDFRKQVKWETQFLFFNFWDSGTVRTRNSSLWWYPPVPSWDQCHGHPCIWLWPVWEEQTSEEPSLLYLRRLTQRIRGSNPVIYMCVCVCIYGGRCRCRYIYTKELWYLLPKC